MLKARKLIDSLNVLNPGDNVIIGVSGGADSVSLLILINELKAKYKITPVAVHVNHGIRGEEALRDQHFVEKLCKELGVHCLVYSYDVPGLKEANSWSEEEAGRLVRHQAFADALKKYPGVLALAHNSDDQVETVLFNLIRGSHLGGLTGMKPVAVLKLGGNCVTVIRPLLTTPRAEIEAFLSARKQDYVTDSTNNELVYSRNIIRKEILPAMERVSGGARAHLLRLSEEAGEISQYLEDDKEALRRQASESIVDESPVSESPVSESVVSEQKSVGAEVAPHFLRVDVLKKARPMLTRSIIYDFIVNEAGGAKDITRQHVEEAMKLLNAQAGSIIILPGDLKLVREYDRIVVLSDDITQCLVRIDLENVSGENLWTGGNYEEAIDKGIWKDENTTTFTFRLEGEKLGNRDIALTKINPSDTIKVYKTGGTKKVSKLFSDRKITKAAARGALALRCQDKLIAVMAADEKDGLYVRVDESIQSKQGEIILKITFAR